MSGPSGADRPRGAPSRELGERLRNVLRKGREGAGRLRSGQRLLELLTVTALLGGGLLILAEFLDLFEIDARDLVVKKQEGGSHHAYAMLVVGVGVIGATLLARSTEQWPPALGIAMLGGFAIAFALIADLPDATRTDLVRGARIGDAHPTVGFWTELVGATIALASGIALVRLLRRASTRHSATRHD